MSQVPFTDREMQRAWRNNLQASQQTQPTNAHRLLLFYAIECGLKAVFMKRKSVNCTDACQIEFGEIQHNINKLLDVLKAGTQLQLSNNLKMSDINNGKQQRQIDISQLNQVWRYGGVVTNITDEQLEKSLLKISNWIEQELGRV
jgi:hypothetical protein